LQVLCEARQSVMICTKNALVLRDLDILTQLARQNLVQVTLSITTLDADLVRVLEPRTSIPTARLRTIRQLHESGVPVSVLLAPVIPGLTDHDMATVLEAAAEAGATSAGYVLLRLPLAVSSLFLDWLRMHRPLAARRVESLIRSTRGGRLDDSRFGSRLHGEAAYAEGITSSFRVFARKAGLDRPLPELDRNLFRPPPHAEDQLRLF
jgi:DNA repair photolyase